MLDEFYRQPILRFQEKQSILNFLLSLPRQCLHESLEIPTVCLYFSFHIAKIEKVVQSDNTNVKICKLCPSIIVVHYFIDQVNIEMPAHLVGQTVVLRLLECMIIEFLIG